MGKSNAGDPTTGLFNWKLTWNSVYIVQGYFMKHIADGPCHLLHDAARSFSPPSYHTVPVPLCAFMIY